MHQILDLFLQKVKSKELLKVTLSLPKQKESDLRNVFLKLVQIKNELHVSFLYRYKTKDITKNFLPELAQEVFKDLLQNQFWRADVFTALEEWHFAHDAQGKSKFSHKKNQNNALASTEVAVNLSHNKAKKVWISAENNLYLQSLGVCTQDGKIKSQMQDKYKQINKFVEIMDGILKQLPESKNYSVADMGSGKGYLTFALYDYLKNQLNLEPQVVGVEFRSALVEDCNLLASQVGFEGLKFVAGSIQDSPLTSSDILIALHACDTATDDAIFKGIEWGSELIVCAPCCHKQIRKEIAPQNALKCVTQFGILEERTAEILTDSIRALILEAYGYKTKVFEFIATEHTPKNVLIVAQKQKNVQSPTAQVLKEIAQIKEFYGIKKHYLQELLTQSHTL